MYSTKKRKEDLANKYNQLETKNNCRREIFSKEFKKSQESYLLQEESTKKKLNRFIPNRNK